MRVERSRAEGKLVERAEGVGRTVRELCQLLRAGGDYRQVTEQIAQARGALETLEVTLWQRELVRAVSDPAVGARRSAV